MKTVAQRIKSLEALNESEPTTELLHAFRKALFDRSPTVRGLAVELIAENKLHGMLPEITQMLNDHDSEVRAIVIDSLAKLGKDNVPVEAIADLLFDPDELVRVAAAEALAELGNESVLRKLYRALGDSSSLVRGFVAEAIGAIGDKRSIAVLEKGLRRETDERAKIGFYIGLSRLDGRNVLPDMIELFESDDYRIRSAVVNSLDQTNPRGKALKTIYDFLKRARDNEPTIAVRSSIDRASASLGQ